MFEVGLVSLLTGNAALMATLKSGPMPVLVPEQAAYPCLSYQDVTSAESVTFDSKSVQQRRIQFDIWATAYLDCKSTAKALRNLLDCYSGTLSDGSRVLATFRINEIDNWEFDGRCFRITVEYHFHLIEA